MMRRVVLHGRLRDEFGESFPLDVSTPAEAIRALCIMVRGFKESVLRGSYRVVRGSLSGYEYDVDTLSMRMGGARELHVVPVVAGSAGNSGTIKIIVGVALVVAAIIAPYASPALFGAGGALAGSVAGFTITGVVFAVGASLALSGIAQLLAPSTETKDGVAQNASFLLGGQTNTSNQGGPVPLVYGRFRTGSVVVSVGINVEQLTGQSFGHNFEHFHTIVD
jgi:predicted phage tail protein